MQAESQPQAMLTNSQQQEDKIGGPRVLHFFLTEEDRGCSANPMARREDEQEVGSVRASTQCSYYFPRKQRFCRIPCKPNHRFCGNHLAEEETVVINQDGGRPQEMKKVDSNSALDIEQNSCSSSTCDGSSSSNKNKKRKRIPCPIDPSHSIFHDNLQSHISKCPSKTQKEQNEQHIVFQKDINARQGDVLSPDSSAYSTTANSSSLEYHKWPEQDANSMSTFFEKIRKAAKQYIPEIPLETINNSEIKEDSNLIETVSLGKSTRHHEQHKAIIYHLQRQNLLQPNKYQYIELGSGRGGLSLDISKELPNLNVIFIDRAGCRRKVDGHLPPSAIHKRIKMDLRHVDFKKLCCSPCNDNTSPSTQGERQRQHDIVGYSKHLCGSATDLSLRGLTRTLQLQRHVKGIVIALCCHHKLSWEDYLNPKFVTQEMGFSIEEFHLLLKVSTWATCCNTTISKKKNINKNDVDNMESNATTATRRLNSRFGLSGSEQKQLGLYCKRLIDIGRVRYLKAHANMDARLVHYCPEDQSLENCLLIVTPNTENN